MKAILAKFAMTAALLLIILVAFLPACVKPTTPTSPVTTSPPPTSPSPTVTFPLGIDLGFEGIAFGGSPEIRPETPYSPQIKVITSKPDYKIEGIETKDQYLIENVEFSNYFVFIVFHGPTYPGGPPIYTISPPRPGTIISEVTRIWQNGDTIYVSAWFDLPKETVVPIIGLPYSITKVSKESLVQSGQITFKLFNQLGQEKAVTTQEISK